MLRARYSAAMPMTREEFAVVRVVPEWLRCYVARPQSLRVVEGSWVD